MPLTRPVTDTTDGGLSAEVEALIREARRRQRRRWCGRLAAGGAVLCAVAAAVALVTSGARPPRASGGSAAAALPTGSLARLHAAGPIAVAPDGTLYVTDAVSARVASGGDRVLVRLPDGRFRAVAGNGRSGFLGDGGQAVRAELSQVSDLAVAPDGTLYIADGGRVRTVSPNGVIHTVAGTGRAVRMIVAGTPAVSAPLGPRLWIALSPAGQLYISTGRQILRLTAAGTLDPLRAIVTSARGNLADRAARGAQLTGFDRIAVDARGDVDVAGGPGGWAVWQVTPNGTAHLASGDRYAHGNGGADPILQRGPGGSVYAAAGSPGIFRVEPHSLVPIAALDRRFSRPLAGQAFLPLYFAFSPSDTFYADDEPFGQLYTDTTTAFKARQQLLSITNHHASLLWQETSRTPK